MAYSPIPIVDKNIWNFDPRIIPGCVMWLDGADTYTQFTNTAATTPVTANGQTVNAWKDKSLSALTFESGTLGANTTAPTSAFNSQNGLPTISFTTTGTSPATAGQGLITTTNVGRLPTARAGGTYFAVTMSTRRHTLPQVFFTYGPTTTSTGLTRQFYYGSNASYPGALYSDVSGSGRSSDGTDYRNIYSILSSNMTAIPVTGATTLNATQTLYNVSNTYNIIVGNNVFITGISGGTYNTTVAVPVVDVVPNTSITVTFASSGLATSFASALMSGNNNSFDNGNPFSGGEFPDGATLESMNIGTGRAAVGYGLNGSTTAWWLNGNIAEILVYNNILTTGERQQVEGYLAWKWGLQSNLANNHPYKNTYSIIRPLLRTFVPTDASRPCLLWFDAADASSLTFSGSNVTGWRDKSGNANNITSFSGTAPTHNQTTNFLTFTGGAGTSTNGTTISNISLTSNVSYTIFIVARFPTLTDSGLSEYIRIVQQTSPSNYFFGLARQGYTPPGTSNVGYYTEANGGFGPYHFFINNQGFNTYANSVFIYSITQPNTRAYTLSLNGNVGTSVSPSIPITAATPVSANTRYNVNPTTSFNVGATVIVSGITLAGGATGYNGIGVVQSIVAGTSVTLSITSSGTVSSYTGAIASSGLLRTGPITIGSGSPAVSTYGVGEVLFYDGALSTQERQRVEGYLAWKWGVQRTDYPPIGGANAVPDFPTMHPMYNFPSATVMPFSPTVHSNLMMWYDGADTSSLVLSGSTITRWNDKSGNVNDLTVAVGPTRTATTSNPAGWDISFNGSTQYIRSNSLPIINGTNTMTAFIVVKNTTNATLGRIIAGITNGPETTETGAFRFSNAGTNSLTITKGSATGTQDGTTYTISSDVYHIINITWNGATNSPVYVDGSLNSTYSANSNTTFSFTRFGLGASLGISPNFTPATFWTGSLNEVIIYKAALTASQRQQVEGYLAWKWGLNPSLPTTHPYYKVPT